MIEVLTEDYLHSIYRQRFSRCLKLGKISSWKWILNSENLLMRKE